MFQETQDMREERERERERFGMHRPHLTEGGPCVQPSLELTCPSWYSLLPDSTTSCDSGALVFNVYMARDSLENYQLGETCCPRIAVYSEVGTPQEDAPHS